VGHYFLSNPRTSDKSHISDMKISVSWYVMLSSLVAHCWCVGKTLCLSWIWQ